MNKIGCGVAAAWLAVGLGAAAPAHAMEFRSGQRVLVTGAFTDAVFAAGRDVSLGLSTADDVFAAGRSLSANAVDADHLIAAAGALFVSGGTVRDLIAAAGEAVLSAGHVSDDALIAGNQVRIERPFSIGGSALLAGETVEVLGSVGGDLRAGGGAVRIDGPVGGKVRIDADKLILGPNARIAGDLDYRVRTAELSPQAVVMGARHVEVAPARSTKPSAAAAIGAGLLALLIFVAGGAVLTTFLAWLFSRGADAVSERLAKAPLTALGVGLILVCAAPAAVCLLAMSLVGIPAAITIVLGMVASFPVAVAFACHALAVRLRRMAVKGQPARSPTLAGEFSWNLLAVGGLALLASFPLLGLPVWALTYLLGLGALASEVWARRPVRDGEAASPVQAPA